VSTTNRCHPGKITSRFQNSKKKEKRLGAIYRHPRSTALAPLEHNHNSASWGHVCNSFRGPRLGAQPPSGATASMSFNLAGEAMPHNNQDFHRAQRTSRRCLQEDSEVDASTAHSGGVWVFNQIYLGLCGVAGTSGLLVFRVCWCKETCITVQLVVSVTWDYF
jgi:hypothetical protein